MRFMRHNIASIAHTQQTPHAVEVFKCHILFFVTNNFFKESLEFFLFKDINIKIYIIYINIRTKLL